jgi:PAS domain S-box-containing protein
MHVTFLGTSQDIREQLERGLQDLGILEEWPQVYARELAELPEILPEGLVVLHAPERSLSEVERLCGELHSRRDVARTHLLVLTERAPQEARALIRAGADECTTPPGGDWLARLTILSRRLASLRAPASLPAQQLAPERLSVRAALQALLDSTSSELGYLFFSNLVEHLSKLLGASCVMVGELLPGRNSIQTLAFCHNGSLQRGVVYPLRGTPDDEVIRHSVYSCAQGVAERFPGNGLLTRLGAQGYLGIALKDGEGNPVGLLAILHHEPLEVEALESSLLGAFAARAGAELERIRAQEELERTRDFLRNTLNAVPDPLCVMDRAHHWVVVNRAFCELMGRSEKELLGRSSREVLPAHQAEALWAQDEQLFTTGKTRESEGVFEPPRGGQPRTIVTKKAVFTEPGGASYLIAAMRDITDRKRLETQLRLADRLSSIGTLAAGVAHEINNPLAYVCSNLSYLQESLTQDVVAPEELAELREVLAETQEGIRRVRTIVQDVKTFAHTDESRAGPVDVNLAIDGALRLVRKQLEYRALLERTLEPVPAILGNEGRLAQVLVNLLVNALQAFPQNDMTRNLLRITTRAGAQDTVVIEVEDNGPGMSPEVRQHIFDPFFTTKPAGEGTGLGLSICQSIIQSMNGRIEVESELGRGSVFRVVLPAAKGQQRAEPRPAAELVRTPAPLRVASLHLSGNRTLTTSPSRHKP